MPWTDSGAGYLTNEWGQQLWDMGNRSGQLWDASTSQWVDNPLGNVVQPTVQEQIASYYATPEQQSYLQSQIPTYEQGIASGDPAYTAYVDLYGAFPTDPAQQLEWMTRAAEGGMQEAVNQDRADSESGWEGFFDTYGPLLVAAPAVPMVGSWIAAGGGAGAGAAAADALAAETMGSLGSFGSGALEGVTPAFTGLGFAGAEGVGGLGGIDTAIGWEDAMFQNAYPEWTTDIYGYDVPLNETYVSTPDGSYVPLDSVDPSNYGYEVPADATYPGAPTPVDDLVKDVLKSALSGTRSNPFGGMFGQGGSAGASSFMRKRRPFLDQPAWLGSGQQQPLGAVEDAAFNEKWSGSAEDVGNRARQMAASLRGTPGWFMKYGV